MITKSLPVLFLGLFLLFSTGCDDGGVTDALGGNETSAFDLDGTWLAETEDGLFFSMRLQQTGAALGGDILVDGVRTGLAGSLDGNMVSFEANLTPPIFFDAEISDDGNQLLNGVMSDSLGTSANRFGAIRASDG